MKTFSKFLKEKRVSTSSEFDGFTPLQEELPQLVKAQNYKHQQEIKNYQNLRELYIKKEIFDIGTIVQDVNTGMVGEIIRRGANHLICVTEDDQMFKSWIKDVTESVVNGTTTSGVPADQRLVGTDAHFKYVASLVPGSSWGIHFINKYKVRKS